MVVHLFNSGSSSVFPTPPVNPDELTSLLAACMNAKNAVAVAQTNAKEAVAAKKKTIKSLVAAMKRDISYAEYVVGEDTEKLGLINWGTRRRREPVKLPGMPVSFEAVLQDSGTVYFEWKAPSNGGGGPVRSYIVERRVLNGSGFDDWQVVDTTFVTEITLDSQPCGVKLEYRVKASNMSGESLPGNTVAIVL